MTLQISDIEKWNTSADIAIKMHKNKAMVEKYCNLMGDNFEDRVKSYIDIIRAVMAAKNLNEIEAVIDICKGPEHVIGSVSHSFYLAALNVMLLKKDIPNKKAGRVFTPDQQLRALTWKQPYGELMLFDKIETRTWPTNYRGWVLICGGITPYNPAQIISMSGADTAFHIATILTDKITKSNLGRAIAIGYLADCRPMKPEDEDRCYVKYVEPWSIQAKAYKTNRIVTRKKQLWCHVYENVRAIEPFVWKGAQGWREVPEQIKKSITFLK